LMMWQGLSSSFYLSVVRVESSAAFKDVVIWTEHRVYWKGSG